MLATEEFFKKKQAASSGGSNGGSSGMATDEFFKKKAEEKKITKQPETAVQPEQTTGGIDINLDDMKKWVSMPSFGPSQVDTAYSGQGTTSMGQGVKIDQTPFRIEQKKKDEDLRKKQDEVVKNAQAFGQSYIEKLKPEEKDLLISGLERKKAEQPVLRAATENDLSFDEYVQSNHFATLPEEKKNEILNAKPLDPYNPDDFTRLQRERDKILGFDYKDNLADNFRDALGIGTASLVGSLGNVMKWIGTEVDSETIKKKGEEISQSAEEEAKMIGMHISDPIDEDSIDIFDSRLWTQKIPQTIPSSLALIPAYLGGAEVGGAIAGAAKLYKLGKAGKIATGLMEVMGAGLSGRTAEALIEGSDTFVTLKDRGVSDEKASESAWGTVKGNMALAVSDMSQIAVTFAPVGKIFPKLGKSTLTKFVVPAGKFTFDGSTQGGEEWFQAYVQQYNIAKGEGREPMSIFEFSQTPEAMQSFVLGATTGMMFGGIGVVKDVLDNFTRRAEAQVDMVDSAVVKDDIDFIPKMEVLVQKEAIAQETVDAVKQLLELKVSEEKGVTYDEWVQQGQNERRAKLEEVRAKLQEFNTKRKEEEKTVQKKIGESVDIGGVVYDRNNLGMGKILNIGEDIKYEYTDEFGNNTKITGKFIGIKEKTSNAKAINLEGGKGIKISGAKKGDNTFIQIKKEDGSIVEERIKEAKIQAINLDYEKEDRKIKPSDLTEGANVSTISKMETTEKVSIPEKPDIGKQEKRSELKDLQENMDKYEVQYNTIDERIMKMRSEGREIPEGMIQDREQKKKKLREYKWKVADMKEEIDSMVDEKIITEYSPEEILKIEEKENPTEEEKQIRDEYIKAVEVQEMKRINEEIEQDYKDYGQYEQINEDSEITIRDLEVLAQRIATTLNDPKIRFGLKRSKKDMEISSKTERYLKTSKEGTLEALTEEFTTLKNGLKEIIEYYERTKKHPYTRQKLRDLYEVLTKGEYDFLESSDVFQKTINPYLYEGKKQIPTKVGKTRSEGARGGGKVSNTDSRAPSEEGGKTVGTSKTGIVNALEKVEEKFTEKKDTGKYPVFAEIDRKTAMEASRGTSFDPEKRGEQRIKGFKIEMEELYDDIITQAKTEEQIAIVRSEVSDLSSKLASKQNEINRAESTVVSSMITGPARFPVERMRKKNEAIQKKYEEYTAFKDRAKNAIIKKLKGQEIEEVGGPIEALKKEIEKMKANQEQAKKINAIIRKYKTDEAIRPELEKIGISEKTITDLLTPYMGTRGIQSFSLTNLNNKIKDREAKLAKMIKQEEVKGTGDETKELYTFAGGKVIDNRGADRVQIIFDERPNSDIMYDLKKKGWKWSPKNETWQRFRTENTVRVAKEMFPPVETKKYQSTELSTKILEKLGEREIVSKEFIQNITNSGDIKQVEKELIREILKTEGDRINVREFKEKVKVNLLPLTRVSSLGGEPKYEFVVLPDSIRGEVQDYSENVYESPVKVSAGRIHFGEEAENYFGHTRIEDMADEKTRRVIEVQSDLYQRGRLEREGMQKRAITDLGDKELAVIDRFGNTQVREKGETQKMIEERDKELEILKQYNDPTAHFRMIREEISQAAQDGKEILQFPTGETAMKIEGLGEKNPWKLGNEDTLTVDDVSIGRDIYFEGQKAYVIVEVGENGKFKAIPRENIGEGEYRDIKQGIITNGIDNAKEVEEFEISDKIDTNNPIYKFYEKEVGRYLKNNYNGSLITDKEGVSWYQIGITPDMQKKVLAFQDEISDAWIYDIVGEKYQVRPFAKEKIDLEEVYIEAIQLAPKGWNIRIEDPTSENYLENVVAYADLATKEIVISSTEARKSTAAHETVHAALSEIPENKRKEVLNASKRQWEEYTGRKLSEEQSEEFLAEEFKYYIENKKYKTKSLVGKIKEFLSRLVNRIKGVFGKDDKIKTFYEGILSGVEESSNTRVGKKFQSIQEDQEKIKEIDKALKPQNKYLKSFIEFSSESLVPIDSVIGNIDESLKKRLIDMEYGIHNSELVQEGRKILREINDKLEKKKETEEYKKMDLAMKNRDIATVLEMAKALGVEEEVKGIRPFLDKAHKAGESVGIDQGYFEEYFPRTTRDAEGLIQYFSKTEAGPEIAEAIKKVEIKESRELTYEEKVKIANDLLMGRTVEGVSLSKLGNTLKRKIETVGQEINPFYNDSLESLAIYIYGMNNMIEQRKLFGKVFSEKELEGIKKVKALKNSIEAINEELYPLFEEYDGYDREKAMERRKEYRKNMKENPEQSEKWQKKIDEISNDIDNFDRMTLLRERKKKKIEEGKEYMQFEIDLANSERQNDLNVSIGAFTLELIKEGKINLEQERILTRALEARFNTKQMSAFMGAYKSVVYITTMGSFASTISQIQDLAFSMHENGVYLATNNWSKALFGFSKIKVSDVGIEPLIFEFTDPSKLQKAVSQVFKVVGIQLTNRAGQESLMNGYYQKMQRRLKNPGKYGSLFEDTWMQEFEFTMEQKKEIINALENNEVSPQIRRILFHKVTQYQPITPSQMPRNYLMHPDAGILYTLKTYQIKQIDVLRQEGFKKISKGRRMKNPKLVMEGYKALASIALFLFMMGCNSDILKDLFLNRPLNISDLVWNNILKIFGFSKYTIWKGKEEGLGAAVLSITNPPFNLFNDPFVDFTYFQSHPFDPSQLQTINNIPVVGKPFYWWFGKGATKSEKKREAMDKAGQVKIKTTKKTSPFSQDLNFSDNSKAFKQTLNFK